MFPAQTLAPDNYRRLLSILHLFQEHNNSHVMQGSGATHVEGDTQAQDEWQRPRWLWDLLIELLHKVPEYHSFFAADLVQVDKCMYEPQSGEPPDQVGGHSSWRVGWQVKVGGQKEEGDVLKVVLMSSADTLNIGVSIGDSSPRGCILWVCKYLLEMHIFSCGQILEKLYKLKILPSSWISV